MAGVREGAGSSAAAPSDATAGRTARVVMANTPVPRSLLLWQSSCKRMMNLSDYRHGERHSWRRDTSRPTFAKRHNSIVGFSSLLVVDCESSRRITQNSAGLNSAGVSVRKSSLRVACVLCLSVDPERRISFI